MEGTCLCGAAKVIVTGEPIAHIVCHCGDCRKWTGSVNYGVVVKHEQVNCVSHGLGRDTFVCFKMDRVMLRFSLSFL